jgi:antitoxin component YwqK of YwqJK toxin-antitoxin module
MKTQKVFRLFLFTCLLLLGYAGFSQQQSNSINPNGYNRFYYANGKLSSEGTMVNGKPDGFWRTYFESGKIKSEGYRKNLQLDSIWKFYNDSGQLASAYIYKAGKKNGVQSEFYANGNLKSEEYLEDNIKNGLSKYYNTDGKMVRSVLYSNGVENGLAREFDPNDGRVIAITTYKNGYFTKTEKINRIDKFGMKQGPWKEFYDNDKTRTEGFYTDDKKNGTFRDYKEDGTLVKLEIYKNGELIVQDAAQVDLQIKRMYHNNGRPKSSVNKINGHLEGVYREYDRDGKIIGGKMYLHDSIVAEGLVDENGKQQGNWILLSDKGEVKAEGAYKDGKRVGPWKFYYPGKIIQQEGKYENGLATGDWKWVYKNGKPLREESYVKGKENGYSKEYDENGNIIAEGEYAGGLKTGIWIYNNNEYVVKGCAYVDGLKDGVWKDYYKDGTLHFEGKYFEGNEDGEHKFYFGNGKLREVRSYKAGIPAGDWRFYDEDGLLILTITYAGGEEQKYDGVRIEQIQN